MFCENCGTQISDDAKFCRNCGSKVKELSLSSEAKTDTLERIEKVETNSSNKEEVMEKVVHLFGLPIKVSDAVVNYKRLKKEAFAQAELIQQEAEDFYFEHIDEITSFETKRDLLIKAGNYAKDKMKEYCYNLLFGMGIYEYSLNSFYSLPGSTNQFGTPYLDCIEKVEAKLKHMDEAAAAKYVGREIRKAYRGRFIGGGFGIAGSIGGALQAGILNAASGLGHSVVNMVGNFATALNTSSNKAQLKSQFLNDDRVANEFFMCVWTALERVIEGALERFEYIASEKVHDVDDEDAEKAANLLRNINAGKLPNDHIKKCIVDGLNEDCTQTGFYVYVISHFPEEYANLCKVMGLLDISIEEILEEYLSNADGLWDDEFEVFTTFDRKEQVTVEDVEAYKEILEHNSQRVKDALSVLNLPEGTYTEKFIEEYVSEASDCHVVDEQYRKIEYIGIDQEFNVFFGPEYVFAETYDDFIQYLKDKEKVVEICDEFKRIELQKLSDINPEEHDLHSGIQLFLSLKDSWLKLADDIRGAVHNEVCTQDLVQEIREQALSIESLIDELLKEMEGEEKRKEEERIAFCYNCGEKLTEDVLFCPECGVKVQIKVYSFDELCRWIFEDTRIQYGERVTIFGISPGWHQKEEVAKAFKCDLDNEEPLIVFEYSDGFRDGFLITDKKFYIKDGNKGRFIINNADISEILRGKELLANVLHVAKKDNSISIPVYLTGIECIEEFLFRLRLLYSNEKDPDSGIRHYPDRIALISDIVCFSPDTNTSTLVRGKTFIPSGNAKLQKIKKNLNIPEEERILMLLDSSMFGSCKVGFVIYKQGIVLKASGSDNTTWLDWKMFADVDIEKGFSSVKIGKHDLSCNAGPEQSTVYSILKNLQAAIRLYSDLF